MTIITFSVTEIFGILVISAMIICLLLSYLVVTYIKFNQDELEIKYHIFGWNFWRITGERSHIFGVFLYDNSVGYQIKIRSGYHHTGTYYYVLANYLKEIEAAWLAQEIQDWLNLR
ncbi:hypothetical protein [Microcoleus sp. CAWBG640]|uniref:hypothetical protein n=1 Tax=Microcoleus sp. CAWBG640 TaxID=2841653 RepID=UPI00312B3500